MGRANPILRHIKLTPEDKSFLNKHLKTYSLFDLSTNKQYYVKAFVILISVYC